MGDSPEFIQGRTSFSTIRRNLTPRFTVTFVQFSGLQLNNLESVSSNSNWPAHCNAWAPCDWVYILPEALTGSQFTLTKNHQR